MIEIRVHLIATNGFPSHNFNSQAFLGNGQSRDVGIRLNINRFNVNICFYSRYVLLGISSVPFERSINSTSAIPGAEVEKANAQGERASFGGSAPDHRFFSDGKLLIGVI